MGERLRILLADASLELVPRRLWGHPEVRRSAERYGIGPGEVILDKSLHYNAMSSLRFKWKRGRPDILHITLLNILDSPLSEDRRVEILFHTVTGELYKVDPSTRIPKHYDRFKGLMAQLLRTGRVPPEGRPLIWRVDKPLDQVVRRAILLEETGEPMRPGDLVRLLLEGEYWAIIGVFPKGDFSPAVRRLASRSVSLFRGRPVKAWTIASRILCAAEGVLGYH